MVARLRKMKLQLFLRASVLNLLLISIKKKKNQNKIKIKHKSQIKLRFRRKNLNSIKLLKKLRKIRKISRRALAQLILNMALKNTRYPLMVRWWSLRLNRAWKYRNVFLTVILLRKNCLLVSKNLSLLIRKVSSTLLLV